jgi:hypothetical protein
MTDARPLLSQIARLTKERDDYRDLCRDFSGAESPEALVAALRDRARMEAEIARLKSELNDANEALTCAYLAGAEKVKDVTKEEIAGLKAELAAAEIITRKTLQSIPVAMDAAVAGACKVLEQFFDGENTSESYEAWKQSARAYIAKRSASAERHASTVDADVAEAGDE